MCHPERLLATIVLIVANNLIPCANFEPKNSTVSVIVAALMSVPVIKQLAFDGTVSPSSRNSIKTVAGITGVARLSKVLLPTVKLRSPPIVF